LRAALLLRSVNDVMVSHRGRLQRCACVHVDGVHLGGCGIDGLPHAAGLLFGSLSGCGLGGTAGLHCSRGNLRNGGGVCDGGDLHGGCHYFRPACLFFGGLGRYFRPAAATTSARRGKWQQCAPLTNSARNNNNK